METPEWRCYPTRLSPTSTMVERRHHWQETPLAGEERQTRIQGCSEQVPSEPWAEHDFHLSLWGGLVRGPGIEFKMNPENHKLYTEVVGTVLMQIRHCCWATYLERTRRADLLLVFKTVMLILCLKNTIKSESITPPFCQSLGRCLCIVKQKSGQL